MTDKVCIWTYDDDQEVWETTCGEGFCFNDGNPITNNMKFCPFCGNKIKSVFSAFKESHAKTK